MVPVKEEKRVCIVAQRDYPQFLLFHWFQGMEGDTCTCHISYICFKLIKLLTKLFISIKNVAD